MAGAGYRTFTAGAVLTAAQVQTYLQDQSVMKFATTSAASSALGTALADGMTFFLTDTDELVTYDGSRFIKQNPSANAIANGDFSKWTRGTSVTNPATFTYLADKWMTTANGSVSSVASRQSFTPGTAPVAGYESAYFLRWAISAASGSSIVVFHQRIEDVRTLAGQTITVSFWAKYDASRTMTINARQDFGTGGSTDVTTSFASQSVTSSWARYSASITLPSIAGKTIGTNSYLELNIGLPVNTVLTADIWGVQLEAGAVATPFKPAGGNTATDTLTSGSAGFDGVLVSTNSSTNPSGSGTPAWAGFDVAGKNKIINGGFDFWQRGTSFSTSGSIYFFYGADRWRYQRGSVSAGLTVSRQASGLTGFQYATRVQRDSGNATTFPHYLSQSFDSVSTVALQGQYVTLSLWARAGANYSGASNTLNVQVGTGTGTDENVLNGYTGPATILDKTATLTTSWQRFSYTALVATNANELGVVIYHAPVGTAGAADYFEVTGVQLEAGSVATPFSRAGGTLQGELAACQRYYYRSSANGVYTVWGVGPAENSTQVKGVIPLPVTMRVTPSAIEWTGTAANYAVVNQSFITCNGSIAIDGGYSNQNSVTAVFPASVTGGTFYRICANNNTSAYLGFSAEL